MTKQKKKALSDERFDELLLDAIDETFSSLGKSVEAAIYSSFEKNFSLKRREIPKRIDEFSKVLKKIFGSSGSSHLEILFIKNLHEKVNISLKWPAYRWPLSKWILLNLTFEEYVCLIRNKIENGSAQNLELEVLVVEHEKQH